MPSPGLVKVLHGSEGLGCAIKEKCYILSNLDVITPKLFI